MPSELLMLLIGGGVLLILLLHEQARFFCVLAIVVGLAFAAGWYWPRPSQPGLIDVRNTEGYR